jgi:hypothetical protein
MRALFGGERANGYDPTSMSPPDENGKVKPTVIYEWKNKPPTVGLWGRHITGEVGIGVIPPGSDGAVRFATLDFDSYGGEADDVINRTYQQRLPLVPCRSKSGGLHLYLFASEPVSQESAKAALRALAGRLGLQLKPKGCAEILVTQNSWMPYCGGDGSQRCGIKSSGMEMSLFEFLEAAEAARLSPQEIENIVASPPSRSDGSAHAAAALQKYCEELAATPDGAGRDALLNKVCHEMGRMIGAEWIDRETVAHAIRQAAQAADMNPEKIDEKLRRVVDKGMTKPPPSLRNSIETAVIVRLSDVVPREVEWLWPNRIALGKLTVIAGHPGLGKSQTTIYVAAQVTHGRPWPNGEGRAPGGNVVMLSAEDDAADTIRPRLDAAGGDPARVHVIEAIRDDKGGQRGFDLVRDIARLRQVVDDIGEVRLIIIDPISAYLGGKVDSHRNADVRAALAPLQLLAAQCGAAVLAVSHLAKNGNGAAAVRTIGSVAFSAAARAVFLVVQQEEDAKAQNGRRLFLPAKNNLGPDRGTGLAFVIEKRGMGTAVTWESGAVTMTADEALAPKGSGRSAGVRDAMGFVAETLRDGPVAAAEVMEAAKAAGISPKTLRNACEHLGIRRDKMKGGWLWRLPGHGQGDLDLEAGGRSEHDDPV